LSTSCWRCCEASGESTVLYSRISPANSTSLAPGDCFRLVIEFMKIMNSRRPKMEPWGTPEVTGEKEKPSRTTLCFLFVR